MFVIKIATFYLYRLHLAELLLLKFITNQEHYSKVFWVQNLTSSVNNCDMQQVVFLLQSPESV